MTFIDKADCDTAVFSRPQTAVGRDAHRDYVRRRRRQIAYGRWEPWADAEPVREHVRKLRHRGATYRAIADAAGVSPAMVHSLLNGHRPQADRPPRRIGAAHARQIMAVTPAAIASHRHLACGPRLRLQALVALGHPPAELARQLGIAPLRLHRLLSGETRTVSTTLQASMSALYSRMWNQLPPEDTNQRRTSAETARNLAKTAGWPPPMALDDDLIDDPAYHPRAAWHRARRIP